MLYSGHLSIADTFSRNQLSQATVKLLYFEPLYSGHLSIADTFSENQWCPLLRGFTVVTLRSQQGKVYQSRTEDRPFTRRTKLVPSARIGSDVSQS